MNYSISYSDLFSRIYKTPESGSYPAAERALKRLPGLPVQEIETGADIPEEYRNASSLFITTSRGRVVSRCPGSKGHVCCNFLTVDLYLGCTLGCTYCIMRNYLNFEPVTVYVDSHKGIERIKEVAGLNPDLIIRAGTGEVGDSLLLDPLFELSREYIEGLSRVTNLYFEMKTKTANVDHLLSIPEKGSSVVGFSLNPDSVIENEEGCAAPLSERLDAAEKALNSGFRLSFHFDPMIYSDRWKELYLPIAERLNRFPAERVAWISLGTLRYPPKLKEHFEERPYAYEEFVPCCDGKHRYLQKIRTGMYQAMLEELSRSCGAPVYLCMESEAVWKALFTAMPGRITALRDIFRRPGGVE